MASEKRLIDANALMEKLYEDLDDGEVLYRIPPSAIDDAPTVDAVEVVRCGECLHYKETRDWNSAPYMACHLRSDICILKRDSDDFCSRGERRENIE